MHYRTDAEGNPPPRGYQLKSPEARDAALAQAFSQLPELGGTRPFGTGLGENTNMPANYVPPPANIYVRNWSRTRAWKRLLVPVSGRRGAEDALAKDKKLREIYNVDTLSRKAAEGADMNVYTTEIHPVIFSLKIPGGPNGKMGSNPSKHINIPPAIDGDTPPPRVLVPEGTWDLYCGNYDRIHSSDPLIRQAASQSFLTYWKMLHNPVFKMTDDGLEIEKDNDFGILEFIREPVRMVETPMDKDYLMAMDVFEAS